MQKRLRLLIMVTSMSTLTERVASSGPTQFTDILVLVIQVSDHRDKKTLLFYQKAKEASSVPQ